MFCAKAQKDQQPSGWINNELEQLLLIILKQWSFKERKSDKETSIIQTKKNKLPTIIINLKTKFDTRTLWKNMNFTTLSTLIPTHNLSFIKYYIVVIYYTLYKKHCHNAEIDMKLEFTYEK